jgi:hypothetical protein
MKGPTKLSIDRLSSGTGLNGSAEIPALVDVSIAVRTANLSLSLARAGAARLP